MALIAEMSFANKNWHKEEAPEKKICTGREIGGRKRAAREIILQRNEWANLNFVGSYYNVKFLM